MRKVRIEVKDGYMHHSEEIISKSGRILELDTVIVSFSYRVCLAREFHGIARLVSSFSAISLCSFSIEFGTAIE